MRLHPLPTAPELDVRARFATSDADDRWIRETCQMMLDLITYLELNPPDWTVLASTSLLTLCLTAPAGAGGMVSIHAAAEHYTITYPLPPEEAPWPDAVVMGRTMHLPEAAQMIHTALHRCAPDYLSAP